ncbi:hypothetical protein Q5752_001238 [Cryptotrichosporon argae]
MGFLDMFDSSGRDQVYNVDPNNQDHKAALSHELIGGAAAFEAMKAYEQHEAREGKAPSHEKAKEIIAGLAGAEIDRLFETKGLDMYDREKAKYEARKQAEQAYDSNQQY